MTDNAYRRVTTSLLVLWFIFALTASAFHLFKAAPDAPPLQLGLGAALPVLAFVVWFAISSGFRRFVLSLDLKILTTAQTWRIGGFIFITLYSLRLLPGMFAFPAGLGDMAIGVTAPFVAANLIDPARRKSFIRWQLLGMLDLLLALSLGASAGWLEPHGVPTQLMTVLPLSLIPTFGVPLFFIFHIISIAQAKRWREVPTPKVATKISAQLA
jgi:hypothetical protein